MIDNAHGALVELKLTRKKYWGRNLYQCDRKSEKHYFMELSYCIIEVLLMLFEAGGIKTHYLRADILMPVCLARDAPTVHSLIPLPSRNFISRFPTHQKFPKDLKETSLRG